MPVTNVIDAVQQKYTALTAFTGKPADLWFGDVWPTRAGAFVGYPFVRFLHQGTQDTTGDVSFEYVGLQLWKFRFEIFAETAQTALLIWDRMMLNGAAPEAASGFRYAASLTVPDGYAYKAFVPVGDMVIDVRSDQFAPSGTPIHVVSWDMDLKVQRVTFG